MLKNQWRGVRRADTAYPLAALTLILVWTCPITSAQSRSAGFGFSNLNISAISIYDEHTTLDPQNVSPNLDASVDTKQGMCNALTTPTTEPFYDTIVGVTVTNDTTFNLRISSLSYDLPRPGRSGTFRSPRLALVGPLEVAANKTGSVFTPIFSAGGGRKRLARAKLDTAKIVGLRTVTFTLRGTLGGRPVTLTGSTTLSFGDVDRCSQQ